MNTMRDNSRGNWTGNNTVEHINAGSLQRIADATEVMAKRYNDLIAERDYERQRREDLTSRLATERRRTAALRGVIKRMKQKGRA